MGGPLDIFFIRMIWKLTWHPAWRKTAVEWARGGGVINPG